MGQVTSTEVCGERDCSSSNVSGIVAEWKDKPLLYIAGPMLSEGNPYRNIHVAVNYAQWVAQMGWAVQIPQLNALAEMISGDVDLVNILDNDFNLLSRCDAVLMLPHTIEIKDGVKTGMAQEMDLAESLDIPIYSLGTLPTAEQFNSMYEVCSDVGVF
jgi:nucleoside 2-deoxyribosyltransferase